MVSIVIIPPNIAPVKISFTVCRFRSNRDHAKSGTIQKIKKKYTSPKSMATEITNAVEIAI